MKSLFRFLAPLFLIAGLGTPAYSAGTIPLSLSQQFDAQGKPLGGCQLFTIQAGTVSTPQNAYQDAALSIPLPNPIPCDAAGRLPQLFLADGQIKVRLTDKNGIVQLQADNILVIGPSSGGGGGGGQVDPTTIAQTGDVKYRYSDGSISGWVRGNGRTIGSASSGATERANADCQALFEYLWATDPNLAVSGGRGASAAADWAANKTITLPDFRGRVLAGLDTMGAASADRLNPAIASGVIGATGGALSYSLLRSNLPSLPFTFSGSAGVVNVTSTRGDIVVPAISYSSQGGGASIVVGSGANSITSTGSFTPAGSISPSNLNGNVAQAAFNILQPTSVVTIFIKL